LWVRAFPGLKIETWGTHVRATTNGPALLVVIAGC